jgi:phytoene dehydrogenase-like protein
LENWAGLSPDDINERKARWVEAIVEDLDRRFPGMASAIDWREMANARTMARYLNTPGGAVYGFAATPPDPFPHPPRVETAIAGLYLASAFSVSGGYTGAITGGSMAARAAFDHPRGGVTLF